MYRDWTRFKPWADTPRSLFEDNAWQDRNAITRLPQLQAALAGIISPDALGDIEAGLAKAGMSIRLNPYIVSLIDWSRAETDPIRRQFLPMYSEQEDDHPGLQIDSLEEQAHSPVPGIVHRYPDKVLFLVTSVCPVYCQYCTRSYAVGQSTPLIVKDHVTSVQNWAPALDYIRSHPQIEDVVVSGGDLARLKPAHVRALGNSLLEIEHVRRIRLATKVISVQPMKILTDHDWFNAVVEVVERGRSLFKDVCVHNHFNHPNDVTPLVEPAIRQLHQRGRFRAQSDRALARDQRRCPTLRSLIKKLGRINIHPYYVYLCDMVKATSTPLTAQDRPAAREGGARRDRRLQHAAVIIDTPSGKRDVHSAEFPDGVRRLRGAVRPSWRWAGCAITSIPSARSATRPRRNGRAGCARDHPGARSPRGAAVVGHSPQLVWTGPRMASRPNIENERRA
jgi:lysine 2,3-aminomutase